MSDDPRRHPERPIVGVGAVVFDADRVLLVKRGREPLKGEWSLPGGAVEVGESLETAVAREVFEETDLHVEVGPVIEVLDRIQRAARRPRRVSLRHRRLSVPSAWRAVKSGSDAADARWVPLGRIAGLPADRQSAGGDREGASPCPAGALMRPAPACFGRYLPRRQSPCPHRSSHKDDRRPHQASTWSRSTSSSSTIAATPCAISRPESFASRKTASWSTSRPSRASWSAATTRATAAPLPCCWMTRGFRRSGRRRFSRSPKRFWRRRRRGDELSVVRLHSRTDEAYGDMPEALHRIASYRGGVMPFVPRESQADALRQIAAMSRQLATSGSRRKAIVCIGAQALCDVSEPLDGRRPLERLAGCRFDRRAGQRRGVCGGAGARCGFVAAASSRPPAARPSAA